MDSESSPDQPDRLLNPYAEPLNEQRLANRQATIQASSEDRLWTVPLLLLAVIMLYLVVNLLSIVAAQFAVYGSLRPLDEAGVGKLLASRVGFVLILVPGQLAIVVPPLFAAIFSPVSFRARLGLVRGHWPHWGWVAAALATPLVGLISTLLVAPLAEESEHLKQLSDAFRVHASGGFLIVTMLMVGGMPAICEELMFRGYIQTRLAKRMHGVAAVIIASMLFAVFHFDPIHVIAVFPIGLWLGFVRHASGSIVPAMLAHCVNNVLSVVSVLPEDSGALDMPSMALTVLVLGLGIPAMLATAYLAMAYRSGAIVQFDGDDSD